MHFEQLMVPIDYVPYEKRTYEQWKEILVMSHTGLHSLLFVREGMLTIELLGVALKKEGLTLDEALTSDHAEVREFALKIRDRERKYDR